MISFVTNYIKESIIYIGKDNLIVFIIYSTKGMISMLDMRILSDPYEEECFLILKSNLPKMKDEDALELYINLKKSYKKDRGLMRYIFDETEKIAQKIITI